MDRVADADAIFAAEVAKWSNFYVVAGTAAATLIGLIFLALSLNPRVMADDGPAGLQAWAGQAFSNFIGVLAISLVMLIPDPDPWQLGSTLLAIGGYGVWRAAVRFWAMRHDLAWRTRHGPWQFLRQVLGYAVCLAVGLDVLSGESDAVDWLVAVVFLLVWSAIRSAWNVLAEMGRPEKGTERTPG